MFRLCLDNGLPAKPYKFVDHFDDYEETDEYKKNTKNKPKNQKIIVINIEDIERNSKELKKIIYINKQLWLDFEESYVVCNNLSKKTIGHIEKFFKIKLAILLPNQNYLNILKEEKIDSF